MEDRVNEILAVIQAAQAARVPVVVGTRVPVSIMSRPDTRTLERSFRTGTRSSIHILRDLRNLRQEKQVDMTMIETSILLY